MNRKLSFILLEQRNPLHTRCIMDLCDYLTDRMLAPRLAASGTKWEHDFMNFFSFDNACDPLQPTGAIFFHVPPLLAGCAGSLEKAIVEELTLLQIKTGAIVHEKDLNDPGSVVLRIPIVDNPTAALQPPEVNMSRTRGFVVLRDLLGYQPSNGRYEFAADELLRRVGTVTEERIAACTTSPVRDEQAAAGVRRSPSPVSMQAVHRCLEEIREFAEWALRHDYHRLAAA